MQFEDWQYHPSRLPGDKHEKEKAIEALQAKFLEEISSNPVAAEFLKSYNPASMQSFFDQYAFRKRLHVAHSEYRLKKAEVREMPFRSEVEMAYKAILQKKLFNLYLLWCAEQITFPGVQIRMDFYTWSRYPQACPFLEPANAGEVAAMQAFLRSEECDLGRFGNALLVHSIPHLQRTDEEDIDADYEIPDWFHHYDTYLGTGGLMLLPDIRGEKEERYINQYFEDDRSKEVQRDPQPVDTRPWLAFYDGEKHYELAKLVDDEIFQELFYDQWQTEAAEKEAEDEAGVYDIEDIVFHLSEIADPPRVRGGITWREALYYCWQDYLKEKVAFILPQIWEEHKFYIETGLKWGDQYLKEDGLADMLKKQILRGRELAGEPQDFNF